MYTFEPDKLRKPISDVTLEKRWGMVREEMKKENVDALVVQNEHRYRNSMVWYPTDTGSLSNPVIVFPPIDDEVTVFVNGGGHSLPQTPTYGCRGIKDRIGVPIFPTYVPESSAADARGVADPIKRRNDKKIGSVRIGSMLGSSYRYLTEALTGQIEFVDFTNAIDELKAIKNEEEIEILRLSAEPQDYVVSAIPSFLKPGMYEYEFRGHTIHPLTNQGSEKQLIMTDSTSLGQKAGRKARSYQNRRIEAEDAVMVMLEPDGPGGLWVEPGRTFILGEPDETLQKVWDDVVKAQYYTASLLKLGATCGEIYDKYSEYIGHMGYAEEARIRAHDQGYDLIERLGIRGEDSMVIRSNMNIVIHPTSAKNGAYAFVCGSYPTTGAELVRIRKTFQELTKVAHC